MSIIHTQCAGRDVHKKTVVVTRIVPDEQGGVRKEAHRFGTMTRELLALSDWLLENGISQAARESTGEYGKPIDDILENNLEVCGSMPATARPAWLLTEALRSSWRLTDLFMVVGLLYLSGITYLPDTHHRSVSASLIPAPRPYFGRRVALLSIWMIALPAIYGQKTDVCSFAPGLMNFQSGSEITRMSFSLRFTLGIDRFTCGVYISVSLERQIECHLIKNRPKYYIAYCNLNQNCLQ